MKTSIRQIVGTRSTIDFEKICCEVSSELATLDHSGRIPIIVCWSFDKGKKNKKLKASVRNSSQERWRTPTIAEKFVIQNTFARFGVQLELGD